MRPLSLFVLVPSLLPASPIRGAIALANGMAGLHEVTLVNLKAGSGVNALLDPRVKQMSLAHVSGGWAGKLRAYQHLLSTAGGRKDVASISMCFSADLLNRCCHAHAFTCASVRGNLPENYRLEYGPAGYVLSLLHLQVLRDFDRVTAMSSAMAAQLARHLGRAPEVIGNFVDEAELEPYRQVQLPRSGVRLAFVGNLSHLKRPDLAVQALGVLHPDARLDVIGVGPLRGKLERLVRRLDLGSRVVFHGYLAEPFTKVAKADVLVLPSLTEGISRAALEALHLGVPCVLRDVDGNQELIRPGYNGELFARNEDLPQAIHAALTINLTPAARFRESLLPSNFRQKYVVDRYLDLIESR